ncbi:MAG: formylglycine-generating enzyme family protein [Candidatus Thiodiazotropha taylori]|nr:formylglycine-generating enzyme family protein [Candidatus Thiodiazotropha taylori]
MEYQPIALEHEYKEIMKNYTVLLCLVFVGSYVQAESFTWEPTHIADPKALELEDYDDDPLVHELKEREKEKERLLVGEFIRIPTGSFRMGDLFGDGDSIENPVHEVLISGFELGKYEVTQSQWQAVMGSNPSKFNGCHNCPVERVSWNDIQDYLRNLYQMTGKRYRLPTEAEWEYACRSGGKQEKYCGGSNPASLAWYKDNSSDKTHPVGQKQPNGLGLYDMSGNVWEWVQDCWNKSYSGAPRDGSAWRDGNCFIGILRGGSWLSKPTDVRSANRSWSNRNIRLSRPGFRLARDL